MLTTLHPLVTIAWIICQQILYQQKWVLPVNVTLKDTNPKQITTSLCSSHSSAAFLFPSSQSLNHPVTHSLVAGMRVRQLFLYMLCKLQTSTNNHPHPYPATFRRLVDVDDDGGDVDSDRIRFCEFGFKLQTVGRFYVDAECRSPPTNSSTSSGEGMFSINPWMNPHIVKLKDDQDWVCAATMEEENTKIEFNGLKIELIRSRIPTLPVISVLHPPQGYWILLE